MSFPRMRFPGFHDGYLTGIAVSSGKAILSLSRSDGAPHELTLSGVQFLRMDDFREGNIVHILYVLTGDEVAAGIPAKLLADYFPRVDDPPHPAAAPSYHAAHTERMRRHAEDIVAGRLALVIIEASYGAEFTALCETVTLQALGETGWRVGSDGVRAEF